MEMPEEGLQNNSPQIGTPLQALNAPLKNEDIFKKKHEDNQDGVTAREKGAGILLVFFERGGKKMGSPLSFEKNQVGPTTSH